MASDKDPPTSPKVSGGSSGCRTRKQSAVRRKSQGFTAGVEGGCLLAEQNPLMRNQDLETRSAPDDAAGNSIFKRCCTGWPSRAISRSKTAPCQPAPRRVRSHPKTDGFPVSSPSELPQWTRKAPTGAIVGSSGQLWGLLAGAENSRSVLFEPGYGLLGLSRGAPGLYCEFFRPPLRRHGALLQLSWGPIGASTGLGRVLKTDRKDGRDADGAWSQA